MKQGWVNFKEIKAGVTFAQVLEHYGIDLKPAKGSELLGQKPDADCTGLSIARLRDNLFDVNGVLD